MDQALDVALLLFWEHGYSDTSVSELRKTMGISAASFYAAFGSKEQLFERVLDRYRTGFGEVLDTLADGSLAPRQALELTLRRSTTMQTDGTHPRGCLHALAVPGCLPENSKAYEMVLARRNTDRARIAACIQRGIDTGDLHPDTDVQGLATLFHTVLLGISTLARDDVGRQALDAAVDQVMSAWDAGAVGVADAAVQ